MSTWRAPPQLNGGFQSVRLARNGGVPSCSNLARMVSQVNSISAERVRQVFQKSINTTGFYGLAAAKKVWRTYVVTSPNTQGLHARVLYAPGDETLATAGNAPFFRFYVDGVAQQKQLANIEGAFAVAGFITDHRFRDVRLTGIDPNTAYEIEFEIGNGARPFAMSLYEVPRIWQDEDDADQTAVDARKFATGAGVYTEEWNRLNSSIMDLWRHQATVHFSWCTADGDPVVEAAGTPTNVLDGSVAGWSASAAGFYFHTTGRNRQFGTDTYSAVNVPVRLWAFAESTTGDSTVIFKDSLGTIGAITIPAGATPDFHFLDTTYEIALPTNLVTVEIDGGTGTIECQAAGMLDYET
jgi:hypothetical protein